MTTELPHHLHSVVEKICTSGCQRVYEIIDILDNKGSPTETDLLTDRERMQVLVELKHIMSVYERK